MIGYKILIGNNKEKAKLDSTHTSLSRANLRFRQLTESTDDRIWIVPMEEGDPVNYKRY